MRVGPALEERIVEVIHERGLVPGMTMPTEPQLMELLGASRNSVREAIRALQALGIVEIRHGYGTFVGEASLTGWSTSLAFRVRSHADGVRAIQDLVEVRELLETGLIGRVATDGVSAPRLDELDQLTEAMGADKGADRAFHALLYDDCGNELVLQLIGLFWDTYHDVEHVLGEPVERTEALVANHRRIVAALRNRDAPAAEEAMRRHFDDVRRRIAQAALLNGTSDRP